MIDPTAQPLATLRSATLGSERETREAREGLLKLSIAFTIERSLEIEWPRVIGLVVTQASHLLRVLPWFTDSSRGNVYFTIARFAFGWRVIDPRLTPSCLPNMGVV